MLEMKNSVMAVILYSAREKKYLKSGIDFHIKII
jgi:hypothetical protein